MKYQEMRGSKEISQGRKALYYGGVARDAVDAFKAEGGAAQLAQQVMVRCRSCKTLNDENAKFCSQCGAEL